MFLPESKASDGHPEASELRVGDSLFASRSPGRQPEGASGGDDSGPDARTVVSSDSAAARKAVGDEQSPVRWIIVGIVDEVSGSTARPA
jgi:hypothetical protein